MILILGGTTEGRMAVKVTDEAGSPYFYSTKGDLQQILCKHGTHVTGGMNQQEMISFCKENHIRLLIDAAHPFAVGLHQTVADTAEALQLPVIRVERNYPPRSTSIIWCNDYQEAIERLNSDGITRLLALTGVNTIAKLRDYWEKAECWFRILKREESLSLAKKQGFDENHIVYYQEGEEESLIESIHPQAILTKESGESGGFQAKIDAAHKYGIPVYAVKRPALPESFIPVTGEFGLRKAIETHVPGFYRLRSGFTTGACATAASKAALLSLLGKEDIHSVAIEFPDGEILSLPIASTKKINETTATATVIKDAGDDPDVTHGQEIVSTIQFSNLPGIHFLQGEGVGKVTLPGLGLEIGGPAINKTPRAMMTCELSALYKEGLDVTISVPNGREIAKRTFNPKLGIVDGISIIGTSGIVRPFSSEAFVDAIKKEIEVGLAVGAHRLVFNSGAKSERYIKALYPELPSQAFIHFGNFIGDTLRIASELKAEAVTLGIMLGKAVKLAEGYLDTHSKKVQMNKEFLKETARVSGCSDSVQTIIDQITLARELWTLLSPVDAGKFFPYLLHLCKKHCSSVYPAEKLTILLIDDEGGIFREKEDIK